MPVNWIDDLHQAVLLCDDDEVLSLIEQIPQEYASLITELKQPLVTINFRKF